MTTQDAYDAIYAYFHRKGAQLAIDPSGKGCFYRVGQKPKGRGCAVGCLIPNELYDPDFDEGSTGIDQNQPLRKLLRKLGFRSPKVFNFLADAQDSHDSSNNVAEFCKDLDRLARHYNLKVPEPK